MLCNRVIVMENGHVACDTTTENALEYYQTLLSTGRPLRRSFKYGTLSHAHLENGEGHKGFCRSGDAITFRIGYNLSQRPEELAFMLVIADEANNRIARMARNLEKAEIAERRNELSCAIQNFNLAPGRYRVHIHITGDGISEVIADALSFVVSSTTGNEVYNNHFYAPKVVYEGIWNIHHGT
jgi:hypothetical protein